jgi:hypothetical protein
MTNNPNNTNKTRLIKVISLNGLLLVCGATAQAQQLFTKPEWLPQLSVGVTESYDDNIFGVSGLGMPKQEAWITKISPAVGFDFAPLLGKDGPIQTLSLNYTPDFVFFALPENKAPDNEPSQDYDAHKFGTDIKGAAGAFSFSLDNAFLYNDGNRNAETYALSQKGAADELDKYRNNFAHGMVRDRLNQLQDHETTALRYDWDPAFVRLTDYVVDYNMNTYWHNTGHAPYEGYVNYVKRSDVNGGLDFGYKVTPDVALTLGYRYGSQYQQPFTKAITSDYTNYSSSTYQQVLLGAEGKPWKWLEFKMAAGPDFRDYNSATPVPELHPVRYFAEASFKAAISANQSLNFKYKQWEWVQSTGFVPEFDSLYALGYHYNASKQLGFDMVGMIQELDYTSGNDVQGLAPSDRADRLYTLAPGVSYAFTPQLIANLNYTYNAGNNELANKYLPSAAKQTAYRNFIDNQVALNLLYKF